MGDANVLPAAAYEAIAVAQATYGVPDRLIAKIAQCSDTQITRNRKLVGWSLRKVSTAYLRGQAMTGEGAQDFVGAELCGDASFETLRTTIERVLWRLTNIMAVTEPEDLDPMMPKQIEAIGLASKHLDKLLEMRSKAAANGLDATATAQKDPVETARVLKKIEKRVHDLAEQRARAIISGSTDASGSAHGGPRVDDERTPAPTSVGSA